MSNARRYRCNHSLLAQFANQIIALELIWPFPLIGLGVLSIYQPALAGLAIVLALLPWLARWLIFGRLTHRPIIGGALLLLIVSGLIGVWASYDPALSWPLFFTMLGSISLFFAIINTHISPRRVAGGLVVAAALLAFYFVGQYGYFDYPTEVGRLANVGRMTGSLLPPFVFFTPHPNAAAGFLESAILLSLVLAWRAQGGERLAWGVAAAVIGYGLLISGSRGAWLGLAVALVIWAWLLIPNRNLRLALGGIGVAGAVLTMYALIAMAPTGSQLPILTSILETANSRLILYRNSLYLLGDYPFTGLGLGNTFAMLYSRYQLLIPVPFLTYSHNLFLSVGLGLGGLGLAALAWLLAGFYAFVSRVEKVELEVRYLPLFRAAWLGATVTFIHGLTDAPQFAG
ncbi:MAG TPA: O-antigen ligase family protein, partial [Anaerolineae bacterium]|nr:O-antigen ligase family protein [Anaerolineae bacterium]